MNDFITLGIETSCDETAIAVLRGDRELLAHALFSQVELHRSFGGVVPEVASRSHLEKIFPLLESVMAQAGIGKEEIDGIAATHTPGLIGCLLVGATLGKALSFALGKPFIGVNHIEGHMQAPFLEHADFRYPFLSLTVSGGHTAIYRVEGLGEYHLLGQTVDDAAGEVLDKIARLAGLGYPGGPIIDTLARSGNPKAFAFSLSQVKRGPMYMSFSGLKTAARRRWESEIEPQMSSPSSQLMVDFIASFQEAVMRELVAKLAVAHQSYPHYAVSFSGGVSVNSRLRELAKEKFPGPLYFSSPKFCTDNAAMIAYLGRQYLKAGRTTPLATPVSARCVL